MNYLKNLFAASLLAFVCMTNVVFADDKVTVQTFYDFLSNPGSEDHAAALTEVVSEQWESIGDYSGYIKSREEFIGQLGGFAQLLPDLNWEVQEMIQQGDRVIVRGRATGTPNGPMFGVDGQGRSFDIMSIDIHTIEDGKIVRTYHIEDWAGALRQLSGS